MSLMSLTEKDLQSIGNLIDTRVKKTVDDSFKSNNAQLHDFIADSFESNNEKLIEEVKDIIDFAIEKSEIRIVEKISKVENDLKEFQEEMNHEVGDLAEMNREFLNTLDNHEHRISKLELKTGLAIK